MSSSFTSNYFLNYNFANNLRKNKNFAKNLRNNNKKNICKKKEKKDYNCLINSNKGYEKYDVNRYFPKNNKEPVITNNFSHESYRQNYLLNDYFVSILRRYDDIKQPAIKKTKKQLKNISNLPDEKSEKKPTIKKQLENISNLPDEKYGFQIEISSIDKIGVEEEYEFFNGLQKSIADIVVRKMNEKQAIEKIEELIEKYHANISWISMAKRVPGEKQVEIICDISDINAFIKRVKNELIEKEKQKLLQPIKISPNYDKYKQKEISVGKKILGKSKVEKCK